MSMIQFTNSQAQWLASPFPVHNLIHWKNDLIFFLCFYRESNARPCARVQTHPVHTLWSTQYPANTAPLSYKRSFSTLASGHNSRPDPRAKAVHCESVIFPPKFSVKTPRICRWQKVHLWTHTRSPPHSHTYTNAQKLLTYSREGWAVLGESIPAVDDDQLVSCEAI